MKMDNKYLLTYNDKMHFEYGWFETEEELKEFAESLERQGYEINEAFEITIAREIEVIGNIYENPELLEKIE